MIRVKRETVETYVIPQAVFMRRLGLGKGWYRKITIEKLNEHDDEIAGPATVIRVERVRREVRSNR